MLILRSHTTVHGQLSFDQLRHKIVSAHKTLMLSHPQSYIKPAHAGTTMSSEKIHFQNREDQTVEVVRKTSRLVIYDEPARTHGCDLFTMSPIAHSVASISTTGPILDQQACVGGTRPT